MAMTKVESADARITSAPSATFWTSESHSTGGLDGMLSVNWVSAGAQIQLTPEQAIELGAAMFGTGHAEIPPTARHIGTCLQGRFVWHVFEDTVDPQGGDASDALSAEVGLDVAGAASSGAGAASLTSFAGHQLRRLFGFDYWHEPGRSAA